MRYFLEFVSKQPKWYITSLADLQGLPYSDIYSAITQLRRKRVLSVERKEMLVRWLNIAEASKYTVSDFIW